MSELKSILLALNNFKVLSSEFTLPLNQTFTHFSARTYLEDGFLVNKEEASTVQKEILVGCNGLTEDAVTLVLPTADGPVSHGYQLHIKSESLKENLPCIKSIARKHNLALDESRKGLVVIYRPCFFGYSSEKLFLES